MKCTNREKHENVIKDVMSNMLKEDSIYELSELFKVFGDSTRIKILFSILRGELCVCDIANVVGVSQSGVSHQLRVLKQARLVRSRKEGKGVYYCLNDNHIHTIFKVALQHIEEEK